MTSHHPERFTYSYDYRKPKKETIPKGEQIPLKPLRGWTE